MEVCFDHAVGCSSKETGIEAMANFYLLSSHVSNLVEQAGEMSWQVRKIWRQRGYHSGYGTAAGSVCSFRRQEGAVIAMEPDTGKILAMVSKPVTIKIPFFRTGRLLLTVPITREQLVNRATAGLYPPGSTFKDRDGS